jgi:hypothetical protein|nr:MAG TPA: hypothetical protein [Caudoviricetes sp.]
MQSIEFLTDYEQKRQQLNEAIAKKDIDTAEALNEYL